MSLLLSMAGFALASSISPGPVNLVALSAGARHGFSASMKHVTGATVGFCLLLLLTGFSLQELLSRWSGSMKLIQWAGVAFLFYMAFKLAVDKGDLHSSGTAAGPSMLTGAAMQWLNPKAWLASVAGMGAYAASGDGSEVLRFTAIYFVICYASIATWAFAGMRLQHRLRDARRVRWVNRGLAVILVASAVQMMA